MEAGVSKMTEYPVVKIEIFIPQEFVERLGDALSELGAGRIGNYEHCMSITNVRGFWRPLTGAKPYLGQIGALESGTECKVEMNCPCELVSAAIQKIKQIHPYEEPLIQVIPLLNHLF
jgi:hypothetical protein